MIKITIKLPKPRNPTVVPLKKRHAGAHDAFAPAKRRRRGEKRELQDELGTNLAKNNFVAPKEID